MNETQRPPLDHSELEQASLGDEAFERELLSEFLASSDGMLSSIVGAVQSRDAQQVHRAAHSLKGCCWTVGARELGAECEKLELQARGGALDGAEDSVTRIHELYQQVDEYVRRRWSL
jgi:HPt (histidine-containing phosphotransfer) domain-containing protein